ncbi:molybdopterin molybdenumtransferase MoeA [bacterium]|nr:MAG: molybdopterin molybdenumtransferase MoeA [bacterium]
MISFPEARAKILETITSLSAEKVAIDALGGRVFTEPLVCPFDVPHFDNSSVDGYAVRAADGNARRIVVGASSAGGAKPRPVGRGEALRIFTGAPLPEGADAVVMQEDAEVEEDVFQTESTVKEGAFIRRQGEEIAAGATFDVAGRVATPPLVGLAASFGFAEIPVVRRPRVVVVGTGNELVPPGTPLAPGQVYASNPIALVAAIRAMGLEAESRLVGDDPAATQKTLAQALDSFDVVITTGGVSVGDHDLVRPSLTALGVEEIFWRVSVKPGKPFYFGRRSEKTVFGLPGNPVSALVTFHVLVRPALRKMLGLLHPEEETTARLTAEIRRKDLRYEFMRAHLANAEGGQTAEPALHQGSHMQTGLALSEGLIHMPEGLALAEAGTQVTVTPLRWALV